MITLWTFVMLGLVLLPAGVLLLMVWLTWTEASKAGTAAVEQERHG